MAKKSNRYLKSFKKFLAHDLQGSTITLLSHPSFPAPTKIHIIAETKNMLVIDGDRMIPKLGVYEISIEGRCIHFSGIYLHGTARTRKKRKLRKW